LRPLRDATGADTRRLTFLPVDFAAFLVVFFTAAFFIAMAGPRLVDDPSATNVFLFLDDADATFIFVTVRFPLGGAAAFLAPRVVFFAAFLPGLLGFPRTLDAVVVLPARFFAPPLRPDEPTPDVFENFPSFART